jgi:hypothetical protein
VSPTQQQPPASLTVLVGWLVPGAGYLLHGQKARGLTVGITIVILFVMGLWIGGMMVVQAPPSANPLQIIGQRPWFMGQVLIGPLCFVPIVVAPWIGAMPGHARVHDLGTLYTAVAGMLNLLVIIDSSFRVQGPRESR